MATGWKKTTKRSTDTLKLLAQLGKAEPIYLRRVMDFLRGVWEADEQNNCLTIKVTKTDGFRVFHNDRCLFFMHIDRRNWALLMLSKTDEFYGPTINAVHFGTPGSGISFPEMWKVADISEFHYLLERIHALPSARNDDNPRERVA